MKKSEMHSETMIQLTKLEAKMDVLLKLFAEIKEDMSKDKPKEHVNPVHSLDDLLANSEQLRTWRGITKVEE